ncbi:zinc finger protein 281 [Ictalurus furcatus]|uniref:zinc finger protein 281 n=1 Tax=Ictalurus furcatus TaxID=66913 RepID=UPI002350C70D|nr:zinc finger protein 281 [Ictalurus furcatus]XP_053472211.1 zinc finger protein 281 [Ictalurus furcatus]XP_053472218.1 zinc finger protein 281 [Ictalurus furcatus]
MSLIQDKLGSEFLRPGGGMEAGFGSSMLMFSHLPPVTSFTRLTGQSVMAELQPHPHELVLKKERHSPDCNASGGGLVSGVGMMPGMGDHMPAMGIKQEKVSELDYRQAMYPSDGGRGGTEMLEMTLSNHQNLPVHDLSVGNLSGRLGKDSSGRKGRRSNGDGQEGKTRRKRGESKSMMLDPDGGMVSPSSKPHICEHCSAAFRSSYHLRRHVLIHTGERPFRCNQCNMSFIQKYLLQRHEKIHSGEKPFSCDQCNMRFIQKYHMERHKRTHSGEKPYKCDTCQQYFSRTDRLLKHKRTCGDGIKKDLDGVEIELGREAHGGHGSYAITQGNVTTPGRKRGKSKTGGEGGKRKRTSAPTHSQGTEQYGLHDFNTVDNHGLSLSSSAAASHPGPSMHAEPVPAPKMAFKKGHRRGLEKNAQSKPGSMELTGDAGMDDMGLLQSHKACQSSSNNSANYDDAMQFLKKRRYLHAAINGGVGGGASSYDVGVGHLQPQPVVVQGIVSGVMDGDPSLGLLDSSPLADIKPDKSVIPDEVLQSLLEHYGHKPDVTFDLSDPHPVELEQGTIEGVDPMGAESNPGGGDKTSLMHEYSRFLLQALERTSHSGSFVLGPTPSSSSSSSAVASFPTYTTSPLEFSFGLPASSSSSSSPTLNSSVPKPHFGLLGSSSPSQGFHLSGLEPTAHSQHSQQPQPQQQLTPSQELTEQLEKQHTNSPPAPPHTPNSSAYQLPAPTTDLTGQKDGQGPKNGATGFSMVPAKGLYQIENFAQAFGQFKSGRRPLVFGTDSGADVEQFSGYSSLLASVSDTKSPQSQSYN